MKNHRLLSVVCLACILGLATVAVAQTEHPKSAPAEHPKGEVAVAALQVTATVTAIDQKTREVTLKAEDGQEYTFIADAAVKNLPQVKKGDMLVVTYAEALAYEVFKGNGETGAELVAAAAAAKPGEMPAGAVAAQATAVVTITAIDATIPTVTFKGPSGDTRTIKVMDPTKLEGVSVGDTVVLNYTKALAMEIKKAPKK